MPAASRSPEAGELAGSEVLLLNWKGPDHPKAGGAEAYCWELGTRLVAAGVRVVMFTARHRGAAPSERIDGITVHRAGGTFTVYLHAALYLLRNRHRFAAVLDSQNGIPFFASMWLTQTSTPVLCVIHHVHQEQFRQHFSPPVAALGKFLERYAARLVYGRGAVVTVSPSSRAEIRMKLGLRGPIYIVPNGYRVEEYRAPQFRTPSPTLVYLGRLVAHKRIELLLEAARDLRERWRDLRVEIAGDGPAARSLQAHSHELGLDGTVTFHGRVDEGTRVRLLGTAWLSVLPSEREGWGLTILEANALGLPAVGFHVPGVRDAIHDGDNGWLVSRDGSLTSALTAALEELQDPERHRDVSARCRRWAARFSWDDSAQRLVDVIASEVRQARTPGRWRFPRRISDCETVATFRAGRDLVLAELPIRRSDHRWRRGRLTGLLLHGADVQGTAGILRRIGIHRVSEIRVARSSELLLGAVAAVDGILEEDSGQAGRLP